MVCLAITVLAWITVLGKWPLVIYLALQPVFYLNLITGSMFCTALMSLVENEGVLNDADWGAFQYAKRASLICAWFVIVAMNTWKQQRGIAIIMQYVIFANIFEVTLLAFESNDYVLAVFSLVIAFFSPIYYVKDGNMYLKDTYNVMSIPGLVSPMGKRWFLRLYYISMIASYGTMVWFYEESAVVWTAVSCIVPLVYSELVDRNPEILGRCFLMRGFMLFWGMILDSAVWHDFMNFSSSETGIDQHPMENTAVRTCVQVLICVGGVLLCVLGDWFFGAYEPEEDFDEEKPPHNVDLTVTRRTTSDLHSSGINKYNIRA